MTNPLTAGLFPGQGSQTVGMGQELVARDPLARDTFAEADAVLGFSLSDICFNGPADALKRTSIAQPALVTISTAYWRLLMARGFACTVVAGHSLGEYSALVAAGALRFPDAVALVRRRGELMEQAAASHPGGMAAIIGLSDDDVRTLCEEVSVGDVQVAPANFNAPGQVVISGTNEGITAARAAAKTRGAKAIPLAVSGPFHSPLMRSAADAFAEVLSGVTISTPTIPVVQNVTAEPTTDPAAIRDALARQITGAVQWVGCLYAMRHLGVQRFIEIGPGNVLTGLVQRTSPESYTASVQELLSD